MFPTAILASLMPTDELAKQPSNSLPMGATGDEALETHPFFTVLNSMGIESKDNLSEQELTALLEVISDNVGENLPLELDQGNMETPESLNGEALLAYLMANSGGKLDATLGSDSLFTAAVTPSTIQVELAEPTSLETETELDTISMDGEVALEGVTLVDSEFSPSTLTLEGDQSIIEINLDSESLIDAVEKSITEIDSSVDRAAVLGVDSESDVLKTNAGLEPILNNNIQSSPAVEVEEGVIDSDSDIPTLVVYDTNNKAIKAGILNERLPSDSDIRSALSLLRDEKPLAEPKIELVSQSEDGLDGDIQKPTSPVGSFLGTKSTSTNGQDMPIGQLNNGPKDTAIKMNIDGELKLEPEKPVVSLTESTIGGTTSASKSISEQVMSMQMAEIQRPMKLSEAGQALVNRIQMMVAGEIKHATIRLDPPELGSLEVKVKVQHEQTHIQIVTQSTQVRDALESQSVRLREALAEQGLNLSNLDVSDQQSQFQGEQQGREGSGGDGFGDEEAIDIERVDTGKPIGLVDHYV
jgi:hypothetical protein